MKQMGLKEKLNFKTMDDRILYMIKNGYQLDYAELEHIFFNCVRRLRPNHTRLCRSVRFLMKETEGEVHEALIRLLNTDFEYFPAWYVDINTLEDRFERWDYNCKNPEAKKVLIQVADQLESSKRNSSLNKFKRAMETDVSDQMQSSKH